MPKEYDDRHLDIDRDCLRQKAIKRYRILKRLKNSNLNIDDKIFMENFETVISYRCWEFWGHKRTTSVGKMLISTEGNKPS
jgi:hypothetical protein